MGNMYLFTADGLFVATLFQDVRQGKSWAMPAAERGMLLNDLTLHDENFWPSITQTADGQVYLVDGADTSLVRVDGLDSIRRLPGARACRHRRRPAQGRRPTSCDGEALRQKSQGQGALTVALRDQAPGRGRQARRLGRAPTGWTSTRAASRPTSTATRKPYNVTAAVAVSGDRLYAAFRTGDPDLLRNSGETADAPFKTGGALDLMIGADPDADPRREQARGRRRAAAGHAASRARRWAVLYRAVVPGTKEPVAVQLAVAHHHDRPGGGRERPGAARRRRTATTNCRSRWRRWA